MTYATPENMTGLSDMLVYAGEGSGGVFGNGILISLYIIIVAYLHNRGFPLTSCLVAAGFSTTITAVFLFVLGLIGNWSFFVVIVLTFGPVVWAYFNRGNV